MIQTKSISCIYIESNELDSHSPLFLFFFLWDRISNYIVLLFLNSLYKPNQSDLDLSAILLPLPFECYDCRRELLTLPDSRFPYEPRRLSWAPTATSSGREWEQRSKERGAGLERRRASASLAMESVGDQGIDWRSLEHENIWDFFQNRAVSEKRALHWREITEMELKLSQMSPTGERKGIDRGENGGREQSPEQES